MNISALNYLSSGVCSWYYDLINSLLNRIIFLKYSFSYFLHYQSNSSRSSSSSSSSSGSSSQIGNVLRRSKAFVFQCLFLVSFINFHSLSPLSLILHCILISILAVFFLFSSQVPIICYSRT